MPNFQSYLFATFVCDLQPFVKQIKNLKTSSKIYNFKVFVTHFALKKQEKQIYINLLKIWSNFKNETFSNNFSLPNTPYYFTVDLLILTRYRDRPVPDRSLSNTVHGSTSVTVHRSSSNIHLHRSPFFQIFFK